MFTSCTRSIDRRRFLTLAGASITAAGSVLLATDNAEAAWPALKDGDVFLTRNARNNVVPGYWNHTALYAGGQVYEAQIDPGLIRTVPLPTFYRTYPVIRVLRLNAQFMVPRMVWYAKSLVGRPYTVLPLRGGYSCVLYVRASYYFASLVYTPTDPGWVKPDHVAEDRRFIFIGNK